MIQILLAATAILTAGPRFERRLVADYPATYQVAVADVNGDGKPDVLALSTQANRVDWFENPTWQSHSIARTDRNIDLAPFELTGQGKLGIALASGFYFADASRGGEIQWLTPGPPDQPADQLWQSQMIAVDPVVHRLRWGDLDGDGRAELVHAPIFGPGSKGPAQARPSHLWAFRPPREPGGAWQKWVIDQSLSVLHGLYVGDLDGDGKSEILTGSFEGIHRFDWKQGVWNKTPIASGEPPVGDAPGAARGSSEVVPVRLGVKRTLLAAIEPWHGHQVVIYSPDGDKKTWKRQVLDESLREGHALLAANFDGDGQDEIIVGWRGGEGGLRMFRLDTGGDAWRPVEIDRGVAVEAAVAADLSGDGKLDLVAGVGRNNQILWYENRGSMGP